MKLEYWYEDMVRFMKDASEFGSYNQTLLQKMQPFLTPDMHICDAGSGLGYLSLAVAPHVGQVTAVERHPHAAAVLEENCRSRGLSNVRSLCADIETAQPEKPYDAMVFCFFGQIFQTLRLAKQQCRGRIFIFTRNYPNHRFSAGTHPTGWEGFSDLQKALQEQGIPAQWELFPVEHGQPLRSLQDARLFFELYSKDQDKSVLSDEFLLSKVEPTGREDFPFYLPHKRQVAFVTFLTQDIPDIFG